MDVLGAMKDTVALARKFNASNEINSLDLPHLENMLHLMDLMDTMNFDDGKMNRWLGWAQAAVVASCGGHVTLDDMKQINVRHKGEPKYVSSYSDVYETPEQRRKKAEWEADTLRQGR